MAKKQKKVNPILKVIVDYKDKNFNSQNLIDKIKKSILPEHTHFMLLPKSGYFFNVEDDWFLNQAKERFSEELVRTNALMPLVFAGEKTEEKDFEAYGNIKPTMLLNQVTWRGFNGIAGNFQNEFALQEELVDLPMDSCIYGCYLPVTLLEKEEFLNGPIINTELLGEGETLNDIYWQIGLIKYLFNCLDIDFLCYNKSQLIVDCDYRMEFLSQENKGKLFEKFKSFAAMPSE